MRKCYLIFVVLMVALNVKGQIKKQSFLLGGQGYYVTEKNYTTNFKQEFKSGIISLAMGKAYKENKVIGINFSFSPWRQVDSDSGNDTLNNFSNRFEFGTFYREYRKLAKDLYIFGQLDASFITAKQRDNFSNAGNFTEVKTTYQGGSVSLTPGISYQLFKRMHIELSIPNIIRVQYLSAKIRSDDPLINLNKNQFLFNSSISNATPLGNLAVGFRFIF